MNPKRIQKEVSREMQRLKETTRTSTFAQDYMKEELEKKKLIKKSLSAAEKRERKERQFALKQQKKKEKQRGHYTETT